MIEFSSVVQRRMGDPPVIATAIDVDGDTMNMTTYAVYAYGRKRVWEHVTDVSSAQDAMLCITELRKYGFKIQVSKY